MSNYLIIVPCYNEEDRIPLNEFEKFIKTKPSFEIDFLFVNDGSKDQTANLLADFCKKYRSAELLDLPENVGKAEAIRAGVKHSILKSYQYIGYFDADLASPLHEIIRLKELAETKDEPFMLLGSRIKILGITTIQRKLSRHYIGRIFATVVSNMLNIPIYDTQCGAKLIRANIAQELFQEAFLSKWLFDVELLFRLKKMGKNLSGKIIEMPLNSWEDKDGSKIKMTYFLQAPIDLLRIYFRYK